MGSECAPLSSHSRICIALAPLSQSQLIVLITHTHPPSLHSSLHQITSLVYGLNFLFLAPNPDDPLNKDAAAMMAQRPAVFEKTVTASITRGCAVGSDFVPAARGEKTVG